MAFGKNTIVKEVAIKQIIPDVKVFTNSSISYNQGDHLIFDTANNVVRAATAEGEGATYLGIAALDVVSGQPRSPYSGIGDADVNTAIPSESGPLYGMTAKFILKTGDALVRGAGVYIYVTAGGRGVASSAGIGPGTKPIGVYQGATISSAAAGQEIEVLVGARYPNDILKF